MAYEEPPRKHGTLHSGIGYADPIVSRTTSTCAARPKCWTAARSRDPGRRGALHATDEVIAVADKLGAGAAKALLGKAALPDDLPWVTGSIGLLGTKPSWEMMTACDTLLMIGSGFPYSEFLPKEGAARGVQIDLKADMLSLRYPMEVNLVGDSAETLKALLPQLQERPNVPGGTKIEKNVADWWKTLEERAMQPPNRESAARDMGIVSASRSGRLSPAIRDPARTAMPAISGAARHDVFAVRGLASMGAAVPYAIAAKVAHPHGRLSPWSATGPCR